MGEDGVYGMGSRTQNRMAKVEGSMQIATMVQASGLETAKATVLLERFKSYFDVAAEWEAKAKGIVVTGPDQTADMQMARTGRLFLREKRVALEKARKELKEQALREGQLIDGIANVLKGLIAPIEDYLDKQEHWVEYRAKEEADRKRAEEERKAEEERVAREKAEREEQERVRAENARLRREAEERERELARAREAERRERLAREEADRKAEQAERDAARAEMERAVAVQNADVYAGKVADTAEEDVVTAMLQSTVTCPECGHRFVLGDV